MPTGCYIAKRTAIYQDDYGNDIETFDTPKKYSRFLLMPTSARGVDYQIYGELVNTMFTLYIPFKAYKGQFHQGDRAYLVDEDLQDIDIALMDDEHCQNANYKIVACQPQNLVIKILFQKINVKK